MHRSLPCKHQLFGYPLGSERINGLTISGWGGCKKLTMLDHVEGTGPTEGCSVGSLLGSMVIGPTGYFTDP